MINHELTNSEVMKAFLVEQGFEVWDKCGPDKERIYINNKELYELGLDKSKRKEYVGCKMHYEINQDKFLFSNVTVDQAQQLEQLTFTLYEQAEQLTFSKLDSWED